MKRIAFLLIISAFLVSCTRSEKYGFEKHFIDKTLRINLVHTGDVNGESFAINKLYDDGLWYGRTKNLINPYRLGSYFYEIRDIESDELIYSESFSDSFSEWLVTGEATDVKKSFNESIRIPYPNKKAKLIMYKIDSLDVTEPVWEYVIDKRTKALMEPAKNHNNRILRLLDSGNPKEKIDIVILGDGYKNEDIALFDSDATRFYNSLMNTEPFKNRKSDFNIHAIQVPPAENGGNLMANHCTFGHDRFALANNEWVFREFATQAPYDYVVILINDTKNCGGSMYNNHTTATIRSQSEDYVIRHEIGHQIVGIADKFYSKDEKTDTTEVPSYFINFNDLINNILDLHTK